MNIPLFILAMSAVVSTTVLCFVLYYSKKTIESAARTQMHLGRAEAKMAELQQVGRPDAPLAKQEMDCMRLLLVFPQLPDDRGTGKIVGWKLRAGQRLEHSLLRTFWGDAAKKLGMIAVMEPKAYIPPVTAEFQDWDGAPQWFRATISSEEAAKLIAELPHYSNVEPVCEHRTPVAP